MQLISEKECIRLATQLGGQSVTLEIVQET